VSDLPAGRLARRHLLALMPCHLGAAQLWAGRHDDAARTLERAASAAVAARAERTRHDVLGQLALLNLARGRLRQARAQAAEAADIAAEARISVLSGRDASHAALARVALEQNDLRTVRRYLEDADRHEGSDESDQQPDPLVLVEFALLRSRVERARRDRRAALEAVGHAAEWSRRHGDPRWVAERLLGEEVRVHLANRDVAAAGTCLARMAGGTERALAQARVHLAEGRPDAALHTLDSLEPEWDPDRSAGDGPIQVQLLRGHAALVLKNEALARQAVARAVDLARPEGYRRTLVEAGTWVRQMFWRFPDFTEARRWLAGEESGTPPEDPRPLPSAVVVERLTQRELQVLTLLGQGLSADEIGTELYVSVNTVKTHLKGIYRKLSASRRREALQRARQLKLN
jgi:LuxR family maltose regulon positive regulatory protein